MNRLEEGVRNEIMNILNTNKIGSKSGTYSSPEGISKQIDISVNFGESYCLVYVYRYNINNGSGFPEIVSFNCKLI